MNDLPFQKVVTAWMADEAYRRLRDADGSGAAGSKLRFVDGLPPDRFRRCIPLVPLKVAAGAFSDPQHVPDDDWPWVEVNSKQSLRPGMFVAQVAGQSMEPGIPDGSYCLFASPVAGSRQGRTVLVQLLSAIDPETGHSYTVKRYDSIKAGDDDSWRHTRIMLKPENPAFAPIQLSDTDADSCQVIAELVEVLGTVPPEQ
jgi:SOS-response transcriptional repressor LexA